MKIKQLLITGIIATLLFVIINFPASFVWQKITLHNIKCNYVTGTIWNAEFYDMRINGYKVEKLTFKPSLLSLLTGQIGSEFSLLANNSNISGKIQSSFDFQSIKVTSLKSDISLTKWLNLLKRKNNLIIPVKIAGNLKTDLSEVYWKNKPIYAKGNLVLKNIIFEKEVIKGTILATIDTKKDNIRMKIYSSKKAGINLNAQLVLEPNGRYKITAHISANKDTPRSIADLLVFVGNGKPLIYSGKFDY